MGATARNVRKTATVATQGGTATCTGHFRATTITHARRVTAVAKPAMETTTTTARAATQATINTTDTIWGSTAMSAPRTFIAEQAGIVTWVGPPTLVQTAPQI